MSDEAWTIDREHAVSLKPNHQGVRVVVKARSGFTQEFLLTHDDFERLIGRWRSSEED